MDGTIVIQERDFLRESNAIEDVWDEESLERSIEAWLYIRDQPRLNSSNIKRTHRILMAGKMALAMPRLDPLLAEKKYLGHYRDIPIYIGNRQGTPHWLLEGSVRHWAYQANLPMLAEQIKEHHIAYENIHPFVDGNGRTGRIFLNWQRLHNKLPILVIPENTKRTDYYEWFRQQAWKRMAITKA